MPLFGSRHREEPTVEPQTGSQSNTSHRSGLFNRSRSPPSSNHNGNGNNYGGRNSLDNTSTGTGNGKYHGFFSSRRHSDSSNDDVNSVNTANGQVGSGASSTRKHSVLRHNGRNRFANEPSILAARQKVADAENAERDADAALVQARAAVREARHHVQVLEREAEEECVFLHMGPTCSLLISLFQCCSCQG